MTTEEFKGDKVKKRKILGLKSSGNSPHHFKRSENERKRTNFSSIRGPKQNDSTRSLTKGEKNRRLTAVLEAQKAYGSEESSLPPKPKYHTASNKNNDVTAADNTTQSQYYDTHVNASQLENTESSPQSDAANLTANSKAEDSTRHSDTAAAQNQSDNNHQKQIKDSTNSAQEENSATHTKNTASKASSVANTPQPKPIRRISLKEINKANGMRNLNHIAAKKEEVVVETPENTQKDASEATTSYFKNSSLKKQLKKKIVDTSSSDDSHTSDKAKTSPKTSTPPPGKKKFSASQLAKADLFSGDGDFRSEGGYQSFNRRKKRTKHKIMAPQPVQQKAIEVAESITIQDLAAKMATKSSALIKYLMQMGSMVTLNQSIDADTAELIITEFGHQIKRVSSDDSIRDLIADIDNDLPTMPRAPVVAVMGHVDHGKTSLLDALRMTDVAADESGGITQHIGAYRVTLKEGKSITFLDTPGHEAFTAMRMRGALITDIIILVVAADDGIKAQTIEAISHAKAANVPIIVAVNKIDLPGANIEKVKNSLMSHDLTPEDYGGDIMVIGVSAKQKLGLDTLEDAILVSAEMMNLSAPEDCHARGRVLESKLDRSRGVLSTLLVQKGTLKVGDVIVAGECYGKIKLMMNDKGTKIKNAKPSVAVEVLGLSQAPLAGDDFIVLQDEISARKVAEFRARKSNEMIATKHSPVSLDKLFDNAKSSRKDLLLILRGDVHGSIEAIEESLAKIKHDEVSIKILMKNVGGITESDVTLASASGAIIIGFNVRAFSAADTLAESLGIEIRYYSVIYDLLSDIKDAMSGLLAPSIRENIFGHAEIRKVFNITGVGKVAGSYIKDGIIKRSARARLLRDNVIVYDGAIDTLQSKKDSIKEIGNGHECGITLKKFTDIHEGDIVEAYELIEEARTVS